MAQTRHRQQRQTACILFVACTTVLTALAQHSTPPRRRETDSQRLHALLDPVMEKSVADGDIPGGVLLVGHNGRVVYRKAFGWRALEPQREQMTFDTVFDLASLTKCIATTTAILRLAQDGRISLNDPVAAYLPEFAQNGKKEITIRELLTHYSGLPPDLDLQNPWKGRETAFNMVMALKPSDPPGARFIYSDVNFEVLGFVVEKVSGESLNDFAANNIFKPLGMKDTRFLPPETWLPRIAPTERDEHGKVLRGIVHDPTARRMGGVAGHAGLFSTADDLAVFAQDLLTGFTLLSPGMVEKMSTPQQPPNSASLRGLGWDIDSPFSTNRGELLPVGSFGHSGFTGTSLWIDPVTGTYIILLTNAVRPHAGNPVVSLRTRIATGVVQGLALTLKQKDKLRLERITGYNETLPASRRVITRNGTVKNGIDVLEEHGFRELHIDSSNTVKVGLVTNQTGIDRHGQRTVDVLAHAPGVQLKAIFSPEHGIFGDLDSTTITDSQDQATRTPVISVYGDSDVKRRPSMEALAGLDIIIFDIQDVGVRFYTYETTLGYFLEAAAKAGERIVVLDRPNPIGGISVAGPLTDPGRESFVSYWRTPVQHGMTIGELARMFNEERHIGANLTVVPMEGWMRGDWFDSTGGLWINPSPNLRRLTTAILYPGVGLIETANVSVGRGTDSPFELVGAPWIVPVDLARYLNARTITGVRFVPVYFTPESSMFAHEKCGGVNVIVTARDFLDAPELGIEIASAVQKLYPDQFKTTGLDSLMVNKASLEGLLAGKDPRRIAEEWRDSINSFRGVRAKYLLY